MTGEFKYQESKTDKTFAKSNDGKNAHTLQDNRKSHESNSPIQRREVTQLAGGSHYWRKRRGGKWIYCGKYGSHAAANQAMKSNGWTNGNGWQFSQGGKKNPPGT